MKNNTENGRRIFGIFAGLALLLAASCGSDQPAAKPAAPTAPVAKVAAAPVAAEKKEEEKKPAFDYQPQILRDPFEPYVEAAEAAIQKEPLEYFDLEEIQILGIISGVRDARAKVKAGNEYFTIRRGTRMGKNHGQVIAIRPGEIVVRERFRDEITRGYKYQETIMRIER